MCYRRGQNEVYLLSRICTYEGTYWPVCTVHTLYSVLVVCVHARVLSEVEGTLGMVPPLKVKEVNLCNRYKI